MVAIHSIRRFIRIKNPAMCDHPEYNQSQSWRLEAIIPECMEDGIYELE
jgi:hypothetical protein